ncbi:PREDICTED: histone acetyltransferase p300-like [Crocodylus porosus]|uniref:histone acetyltransferase p300-like n=1 Tax=Crocodylus porosus TaxID=8502 RepID=UPI00093C8CEE|nr:PREDICTED: histone acetyltransferase p300-like [Crocodylus porosus]
MFLLGINFEIPGSADKAALGTLAPIPRAPQSSSTGRNKQWQEFVCPAHCEHIVHGIVEVIYPIQNRAVGAGEQMERAALYAQRLERDSYEEANSREEYYMLLIDKISETSTHIQELERNRRQGPDVPPAVGDQGAHVGQP